MEYFYKNKSHPNLDTLESLILESTIASTYIYLKWDEQPDEELEVELTRELTGEEKTLLDNLVAQI